MKILKFPKDKMKYPRWWMWIKNINIPILLNNLFSGFSLFAGLVIILFIIYCLNKL